MYFLPLGASVTDETVAESNANPLAAEDPNVQPVTTIAAYRRANVKPLDYIPPTPTLIGTGGSLSVSGGFRIHSYTGTGSSTFSIDFSTPFDPYA